MQKIILVLFLISSICLNAQIESGNVEKPEKKEKKEESSEKSEGEEEEKTVIINGEEYVVKKKVEDKEKKKKEIDDKPLPTTGRFLYASAGPFITSSIFDSEIEGRYASRYEEKADWGFTSEAGIKVNLNKIIQIGIGFGYAQYRQSYQYNKPDSISFDTSYNYVRRHQYIYVPLRLNLIHGDGNFKFFYGISVIPGMQLNQSLIQSFTTSEGSVVEEQKKVIKNDINHFQIMLGAYLGAEYHFSKHLSAFLSPEFRYNPITTDLRERFTNNLYGLSIRLGVQFQL